MGCRGAHAADTPHEICPRVERLPLSLGHDAAGEGRPQAAQIVEFGFAGLVDLQRPRGRAGAKRNEAQQMTHEGLLKDPLHHGCLAKR